MHFFWRKWIFCVLVVESFNMCRVSHLEKNTWVFSDQKPGASIQLTSPEAFPKPPIQTLQMKQVQPLSQPEAFRTSVRKMRSVWEFWCSSRCRTRKDWLSYPEIEFVGWHFLLMVKGKGSLGHSKYTWIHGSRVWITIHGRNANHIIFSHIKFTFQSWGHKGLRGVGRVGST